MATKSMLATILCVCAILAPAQADEIGWAMQSFPPFASSIIGKIRPTPRSQETFMMRLHALVGITLMMAGNAFAQEKGQAVLWTPRPLMSGEVPMPDRIVRSDIVVLGRVIAVEPKDVEAVLSSESPYKLDYRIAVVKVQEVIHGQKDVKELRLGFVSPDQDRKVDKTGKAMPKLSHLDFRLVTVGQEGLFFLRKHHQGGFYVNFLFFNSFLPSSESPEFAKNLENARRLSKVLDAPVEALKAENATNRFVAATMLIHRHRLSWLKERKLPEKAIDSEESKLLLKTLAEADWQDVNEAITTTKYPPHPYRVFLQLGVKKTDGYDPPMNAPDFRDVAVNSVRSITQHDNGCGQPDTRRVEAVG